MVSKKTTVMLLVVAVVAVAGFFTYASYAATKNNVPLAVHSHITLKYNINGKAQIMPAGIGISGDLWRDHRLDEYGSNGLSPLHTHDSDNVIHVESTVKRDYTLGDFLDVWGLNLEGNNANVCSISNPNSMIDSCLPLTDYRGHILKDGEMIKIDVTQ